VVSARWGEVELRLSGGSKLSGSTLLERGNLQQVRGLAVVTQLPSHIPQRMASRAENLLHQTNLRAVCYAGAGMHQERVCFS